MSRVEEQFLESKDVFVHFRKLANQSNKIRIAVAYLTQNGYDIIDPDLRKFLKKHKGNTLELIVGLSSYCITEPSSIESLLRLRKAFSSQVNIRYYYNEGFHPKLFIFEKKDAASILIGSSNLTWQGMRSNVEANLLITEPRNSALHKVVIHYFERLMQHADKDLGSVLITYTKDYNRLKKRKASSYVASPSKKSLRTSLPPDYFDTHRDRKDSQELRSLLEDLPRA
jgi:HKD family nuclease